MWEWTTLVAGADRRSVLMIGIVAVALAVALAASSVGLRRRCGDLRLAAAPIVLVHGHARGRGHRAARRAASGWRPACSMPVRSGLRRSCCAPIPQFGFVAIIFLFAVVWATDIAAYFVGRAIGGPKLAPRVSPNKTWSGAIGGLRGRRAGSGAGRAVQRRRRLRWSAVVVAIALSIAAQAGDLFESAFKRRFGAKDASGLIPGHGGLMDRLDGFVAAAVLALPDRPGAWRHRCAGARPADLVS